MECIIGRAVLTKIFSFRLHQSILLPLLRLLSVFVCVCVCNSVSVCLSICLCLHVDIIRIRQTLKHKPTSWAETVFHLLNVLYAISISFQKNNREREIEKGNGENVMLKRRSIIISKLNWAKREKSTVGTGLKCSANQQSFKQWTHDIRREKANNYKKEKKKTHKTQCMKLWNMDE